MKPKISYVNLDAKYRSKEENLNYDKRRKFINQVVILDELSENLEALEETQETGTHTQTRRNSSNT